MRRTVAKVSVLTLLGTTLTILLAGGVGDASVTDVYQRATFVDAGARTECTSDGCAVPIVVPESFSFSSVGSPYDLVVTVTLTFQTSPHTRMIVGPHIQNAAGNPVTGITDERPIGSSTRPRSIELSWLVEGLVAGQSYRYWVGFGPEATPAPSTYFVETADVVSVLEATPA